MAELLPPHSYPSQRTAPPGEAAELSADYVVFGAGAMGMAFVDTLVHETKSTVVLVDERAQPGGHWNDAYPFVRLHQPAAFYGVNSRQLELKRGDYTYLSSKNANLVYYEQVLEALLATGRAQYFPLCTREEGSSFRALADGRRFHVRGARVVDATYMQVEIPSTSPATQRYDVAEGVALVPVNGLAALKEDYEQFVVIGAGKTGMDAVLFLRSHGVDPGRISWIMPRDAWILDRASITSGRVNYAVHKASIESQTIQDFELRLEECGWHSRLDPSVWPTRNKCATASAAELELLRSVTQVVRLGRVRRVEPGRVVLAMGTLPTPVRALHVDCTTDGLAPRPVVPIFGDVITLQPIFVCQQVFSAAFLAHLEARGGSAEAKNALARPAAHPDTPEDLVLAMRETICNQSAWLRDRKLMAWLERSRLFVVNHVVKSQYLWAALRDGNYAAVLDPLGHNLRIAAGLDQLLRGQPRMPEPVPRGGQARL